jgi:superfamily II DNA or RNA helicase
MPAAASDTKPVELANAASLAVTRAIMASCILGNEPEQLRIGDITLHSHQRSAVARIQRTIGTSGGALLCDRVGLGKTYVALAVGAQYDSITIIAPASLASMWRHALTLTHLGAEFISIEALGRNGGADRKRSFVIVDEAHNFRNPCTRRYAALAHICMLSPVLLLTATPIHNSRDDISAIAALFLGSRSYQMSDLDLATIVVRRETASNIDDQNVPFIEHATSVVLDVHEPMLDMIQALPAPVPPSDGESASRLVIHGLVRQWASSNAALVGALKRRIARSHGLLASLDAGRYPTAAELAAWVYTGDAVQLAFAEWLPAAITPLAILSAALRDHVEALTNLLAVAKLLDDDALAIFVRDICAKHPGEKIVAFSCYAETATAVYRALRPMGHIALLTARGAMIASGPVSRADVLAQFTPSTEIARKDLGHAEIDLLVATDLLSEGVNLQEASIVIHLDLPWTASKLEQRIGRLARLGSRHHRVVSYSVHPPPRTESFLRELEIIARKSDLATRLFGNDPEQRDRPSHTSASTIAGAEDVRVILEKWRRHDIDRNTDPSPSVAAAHAHNPAILGSWVVDGEPMLLVWNAVDGVSSDPARIHAAVKLADSATQRTTSASDTTILHRVRHAAEAWYEQRCAWAAIGGTYGNSGSSTGNDTRKSLARVADATATNAVFARRSHSASVAGRLRSAAGPPMPLAVEWSLESLSETLDDAAVDTILDLVDRARPATNVVRERGIHCVALIITTPAPAPRLATFERPFD